MRSSERYPDLEHYTRVLNDRMSVMFGQWPDYSERLSWLAARSWHLDPEHPMERQEIDRLIDSAYRASDALSATVVPIDAKRRATK